MSLTKTSDIAGIDSNPIQIVMQGNDCGINVCPPGFWAIYRGKDFNREFDASCRNVLISNRSILDFTSDGAAKLFTKFLKSAATFSIVNKTSRAVTFYSEPRYGGKNVSLAPHSEMTAFGADAIMSAEISAQENAIETSAAKESEEVQSIMYMGILKGENACPEGYAAFYEHPNFNEDELDGGRCLLSRIPFSPRLTLFGDTYGCVGSVVNRTDFDIKLHAPTGDRTHIGRAIVNSDSFIRNLSDHKFTYRLLREHRLLSGLPFLMKGLVSTIVGKISPIPFLLSPLSNLINEKIDESDLFYLPEMSKEEYEGSLRNDIESVTFEGLSSESDISKRPMKFRASMVYME